MKLKFCSETFIPYSQALGHMLYLKNSQSKIILNK